MFSSSSFQASVADCFRWAISFAITSEDNYPTRAIVTITAEVSTPTRAMSRLEMSLNVLSSYPSTNAFSTPPMRSLLHFGVLLTTTNLLQSNLYSLKGMTSSWASCSGPFEESGVGVIGSTKVYDSTPISWVSFGSWELSDWLSFRSCFSEPRLAVVLGSKPRGIYFLTSRSFGSGGEVSFGDVFSFSEGSSVFSYLSLLHPYFLRLVLPRNTAFAIQTFLTQGLA